MDIDTLKEHYLSFEGRINRKVFILRVLRLALLSGIFLILPLYFALSANPDSGLLHGLFVLVELLCIWPTFSLYLRRLHDLDKSAWWVIALIIPIVSVFFVIYVICFKGTAGPNRFGEDPLMKKAKSEINYELIPK